MRALFEVCKGISAADVAEQAGLALRSRGRRAWTCCPLHGENTASLMFDDAGGWHCFGCGRGGDAVAFYAALYQVPMGEAAKQLAAQFGLTMDENALRAWAPPPVPPARKLKNILDAWYRAEWDLACRLMHRASALIKATYARRLLDPYHHELPEDFYSWVAAKAAAECRLEVLEGADLYDRIDMMVEEQHEHQQAI